MLFHIVFFLKFGNEVKSILGSLIESEQNFIGPDILYLEKSGMNELQWFENYYTVPGDWISSEPEVLFDSVFLVSMVFLT
jgi:hypothetical protein